MASSDTFDLIVIGCGPAGEKAGAQAAYFGKSVAVIERAGHMGGSCIVGRARFESNARGHIAGDTAGLLKLIFARADKKLLGVSLIGENATELIHIGMMVLDHDLAIDEFIEQVFNYPTLSETYKYAAYDGLGNLAGHKLREG